MHVHKDRLFVAVTLQLIISPWLHYTGPLNDYVKTWPNQGFWLELSELLS